jgi:hypothetical protein
MMERTDLNAAWVKQAQLDVDRGVIECRVCRTKGSLADSVTLWRNGVLVFASCSRCMAFHDILMRPTERGIEVRAHARYPLVVGGVR